MIFDTEEELARSTVILNFILSPHCQVNHQPSSKMFCRFLQGGYSPAGQANQSEFYGSIGLQSLSLHSLLFLTKISPTLFFLASLIVNHRRTLLVPLRQHHVPHGYDAELGRQPGQHQLMKMLDMPEQLARLARIEVRSWTGFKDEYHPPTFQVSRLKNSRMKKQTKNKEEPSYQRIV